MAKKRSLGAQLVPFATRAAVFAIPAGLLGVSWRTAVTSGAIASGVFALASSTGYGKSAGLGYVRSMRAPSRTRRFKR